VKRWAAIIALLPFSALLVVSIWLLTRPDPGPASFESPIRPVPVTQMTTLDGKPTSLPDLKGRPYLVNIWASWCTPCRAEHPYLVKMAQQNVEIVGVLYKDPNIPLAQQILDKEGNPFASIVLDRTGDLGLDVGISGVPETFLVDASGMIVKTMRGPIVDDATAQRFIDAYRAETAKAPATPAS
jgi:cytochrome c biogenesis protein CcmG, thiol:disulfide interchange protein DsbE